ncbi:MAG: efflux transporter outer membrane subunit [Burkholderiales bacterium]
MKRVSLITSVFVTACTVGPAYQPPAVELPEAWKQSAPRFAEDGRWWRIYGDPDLERTVEEALKGNGDLLIAAARVDEARAVLRIADSQFWPAVDATADANRNRSSERSSIPLPPGTPLERTTYRAQLNVAYELDLWGRLRRGSEAAQANLLGTQAAQQTVRITLTSEVARAYYGLIAFDTQVEATRRSLELRANGLELQKARHAAGIINDFTLKQLEAEVYQSRAQLPALDTQRNAQELALAVLVGRSPRAIMEGTIIREVDRAGPAAPVVPEGLPSDLLLRRPDVVEAEQRLIASNARIGEARAALFPRIGLTGYYGGESSDLSDLFTAPARIWSLAFGLAQPIFQGGRLFGEVEAVEARQRQTVALYQRTLQEAFREVRTALYTQVRAREAFEAEGLRVDALTETLRLARIRYENGLLSQLEVLDAERNLLQAQLNRADALRVQRAAVADVVRALGGGWQGFDAVAQRQP